MYTAYQAGDIVLKLKLRVFRHYIWIISRLIASVLHANFHSLLEDEHFQVYFIDFLAELC